MKVELFGATGQLGRQVLRLLLDRGHQPRVLVRNALNLSEEVHPHDIIEGDTRNPRAVSQTLAGVNAVISTLGMADITQPGTDLSDALKTILSQMRDASLSRIIAIGGASVLPHPDGGLRKHYALPDWLHNVSAEHERQWMLLAASPKDWTLVCPAFFTDDLRDSTYRVEREALPEGSDFVMVHDLADFVVRELETGEFVGARVGIVSDRVKVEV